MKRILPILFAILLSLTACKKDKPAPESAEQTDPGNNPADQPSEKAVVTDIFPASGLPNTLVTITGSNFGTNAEHLLVFFNGVKASIQTVTATQIKVLVPITTTGSIMVVRNNMPAAGPVFNYIFPELNAPYVSGDVTLHNQAEVDVFANLNKGKQLKITGNLNIGGSSMISPGNNSITSLAGLPLITSVSGQIFLYRINLAEASFLNSIKTAGSIYVYSSSFKSLSFSQLEPLSGPLTLTNLDQLARLDIKISPDASVIRISSCPLLTDLSFLNNLSTAGELSLSRTGASTLIMNQLTTIGSLLSISGANLTSASFKSLATVGSSVPIGNLSISSSPLLTSIHLNALTTLSGKLTIRGTNISNMTGFGSLKNLGSLLLEGNPGLSNLQGLEQLINITSPAVVSSTLLGSSMISRVNGVYISNNAKLSTLEGLQNIKSIPVAYITDNPMLDDVCPFKSSITALNDLPSYTFTYRNQLDQYRTMSVAALTLSKNGNYLNKQSVLDALTLCK